MCQCGPTRHVKIGKLFIAKLFIGGALAPFLIESFPIASAHAQEVKTDAVLICATAADAKSHAAIHKDEMQTAIASESDSKSRLVASIAFMPGKQTERIQQKDATYAVTKIRPTAPTAPSQAAGRTCLSRHG